MVALALVLLVLVLLFAGAVLLGSSASFDLTLLGATVPVTSAGVFLAGAAAMLVACLALTLLVVGLRRSRARRRRIKALRSAAVATPGPSAQGSGGPRTEISRSGDAGTSGTARTTGGSSAGSADAPSTTAAERQSLLDETDEATRDHPHR